MSPDAAAATATAAGGVGDGGGGGETSGASPSPSPAATARAASTVRWDQILPRRALRVLLVEHDDCTRQVVTALLRKCGYRVAAVADGMKAWDVMRERAYAFDLVLTEVAMPTISGIQLLARIVQADDCKNIPVIMMSSQDSIGTVLKCMQNGAVDFLVKPVRKNELCNLWQHVWRRHAMNSRTNASENNAASNHISVNAGNGSKTGENSDEESDAQSFGSKREPEIQSVEKLPDSLTDERAGSSRKSKIHSESQDGVKTKAHAPKGSDDAPGGSACKTSKVQAFSAERNARSKCLNGITSAKLAEQIMDNALRIADASSRHANNLGKDMATTQPTANRKCKSTVMENNDVVQNTLGESLKRAEIAHAESCPSEFKVVDGYANQGPREKDIFSHSNSSAFLRYGNQRIEPSAQQQFSPSLCITRQGHGYEKDPLVRPSEVLPPRVCNTYERAMQAPNPLDGSTDGAAIMCFSSAREDAGASSSSYRKDGMSHPSYGFIPLPIPVGATMPYHYSAILQPLYYAHAPLVHSDSAGINKATFQHTSSQLNYHENTGKTSQIHEQKQFKDQQLHHSRQIVRESGDSVDLARPHAERVNQSASCSQDIHKGSGCTGIAENDIQDIHKGSGCTGIAENGINTNTVVALESGNESGVQNCGYNGFDSNRSRREAALIKFRMKRKDRCFEKKVRYHSRKKLADQRPRVKGQFVSQNLKSATTIDVESD